MCQWGGGGEDGCVSGEGGLDMIVGKGKRDGCDSGEGRMDVSVGRGEGMNSRHSYCPPFMDSDQALVNTL